jgi:electron transport complex protein RnfA
MDTIQMLAMGFLSIVIVNNFVFTKFLGTCPYIGVSGRLDMAFGMGLAVTFVTTLSGAMTFLLDEYVLIPLAGGHSRVCYILVIAGAAACGDTAKVFSAAL